MSAIRGSAENISSDRVLPPVTHSGNRGRRQHALTRSASPSRCSSGLARTGGYFAPTRRPRLFVEPGVLHAPVVDDAVDHHCPTLDLRLPAIGKTIVKDDWPRAFLGQLPFNLPYQLLALSFVSLH